MTDQENELIIRAINGDIDALNEVQHQISERLEKEIENNNPFLELLRAMFDPSFFADEKSKADFINRFKNNVIK